jgi:RNA polymerase sigma-70 factor (ECF subfamily)
MTVKSQAASDEALFNGIYTAWFERVRRWTQALATHPCDPDDIAQNVFLIVYRRLPQFDGKHVAGWLYRITANQIRDHRRSRWARVRLADVDVAATPGQDLARALELRDTVEAVDRVLADLPRKTRAAFILHASGHTGREIADMHGSSQAAVFCRVRRARLTLAANGIA